MKIFGLAAVLCAAIYRDLKKHLSVQHIKRLQLEADSLLVNYKFII